MWPPVLASTITRRRRLTARVLRAFGQSFTVTSRVAEPVMRIVAVPIWVADPRWPDSRTRTVPLHARSHVTRSFAVPRVTVPLGDSVTVVSGGGAVGAAVSAGDGG